MHIEPNNSAGVADRAQRGARPSVESGKKRIEISWKETLALVIFSPWILAITLIVVVLGWIALKGAVAFSSWCLSPAAERGHDNLAPAVTQQWNPAELKRLFWTEGPGALKFADGSKPWKLLSNIQEHIIYDLTGGGKGPEVTLDLNTGGLEGLPATLVLNHEQLEGTASFAVLIKGREQSYDWKALQSTEQRFSIADATYDFSYNLAGGSLKIKGMCRNVIPTRKFTIPARIEYDEKDLVRIATRGRFDPQSMFPEEFASLFEEIPESKGSSFVTWGNVPDPTQYKWRLYIRLSKWDGSPLEPEFLANSHGLLIVGNLTTGELGFKKYIGENETWTSSQEVSKPGTVHIIIPPRDELTQVEVILVITSNQ